MDDGAATAAVLTSPSAKGAPSPAGRAGREVCRQAHRATTQGEDSGCSRCGGGRSQHCHPIQPGAQVLNTGVAPRVLCSAPGTKGGGSEGLWGSASPLGLCSLAGDPQRCSLQDVIPRVAGEQAASPAGAPLLRQGSKPTHLGLRTINFPNLHNDQLLRRTISRSQIVIVISLLILIWPNEG